MQMPSLDIYEWLLSPKIVRPRWVLIGILVAFTLCCVAGRIIARQNIFLDFHRFHNFINPRSAFYPTISEMTCIAEAGLKLKQTIVVIGGNSIFYGYGQNLADIWTDELQRLLGNQFKVVNFAMPGSEAFEGAYCAAESLMKRGRKVIYVTDASPATTDFPEGSPLFGYSYWDAREKRLLLHDKDRDALIESRIQGHQLQKRQRIDDLRIRMQLDSLLYFEDLWTAVAYRNLFTVWTVPTAAHPFLPRKDYAGETYVLPSPEQRMLLCSNEPFEDAFKACFEPGTILPKENFWAKMLDDASRLVPTQNKKACLVVISTRMPLFLSKLSPINQRQERTASIKSEKVWITAGYNATDFVGLLTDDDFNDTVHLNALGGKKIAAYIAARVRELNSRLGYDK